LLQWRSYFRFVNYEWDGCPKWRKHWEDLQKTSSKPEEEISRRIFFRDTVDPSLDLYIELSEQERPIFISSSRF
jgi:hypothetical protein